MDSIVKQFVCHNIHDIKASTSSYGCFYYNQKNHRKYASTLNISNKNEEKDTTYLLPSTSPTSLNLLSYISKSNFQSIYMLPEIQSIFPSEEKKEGISNVNAIELLNRAHEVFSSFPLPPSNTVEELLESNPLVAVLLLLAHYQNKASLYEKSSATIRSIRSILPVSEHKDIDMKSFKSVFSFPFALIEAQAKLEWKAGNFLEVERLAKEMNVLIPEKRNESSLIENDHFINQMNISSLSALGLSQLLMFSNDFLVEEVENDMSLDDSNIALRSKSLLKSLKQAVSIAAEQCELIDSSIIVDGKMEDVEKYLNLQKDDNYEDLSEHDAYLGLLLSQTLGNYGIAQAVSCFAYKLSDKDLDSLIVTSNDAIESWRKGILIIDKILAKYHSLPKEQSNHYTDHIKTSAKLIKANLECNIAQSILFPTGHDWNSFKDTSSILIEDIAIASKSSRDALVIYDELIATAATKTNDAITDIHDHLSTKMIPIEPMMSRALCLVASCYFQAGSAVTAQGLFQSCLDVFVNQNSSIEKNNTLTSYSPYTELWHRDTLGQYSNLCKSWEKRETDAAMHINKRDEIMNHMSIGWRNQPGLLSGLSFFSFCHSKK